MHKPGSRNNESDDRGDGVTFIAQPVRQCASHRWRQIIDRLVRKAGGLQRALKIGQCNCSKQKHAQPVVNRLHNLPEPAPRLFISALRRPLRLSAAVSGLLMITACNEGALSGQVIAEYAGQEITQSELRTMQAGLARSEQRSVGEAEALDALLDRKILAQEAVERGVDKDETFHFELRAAREELLVQALARQVEKVRSKVSDEEVDRFLASQPWRFEDRFVLELRRPGQISLFDSFDASQVPSQTLMEAKAGAMVDLAGVSWKVTSRTPSPLSGAKKLELARAELERSMKEKKLANIVAENRQTGVIRYQSGFGPSNREEKR